MIVFRIVFPMKCRPTEDVGMYFWLETKLQGKQPPRNSPQSYFSHSHFLGGLWMMTFTVFDQW